MGGIIAVINTTRAIILTTATIRTTIAISHEEKSVMFIAKKAVTLTSIWMMSSRKQKSFRNKTKNSAEINANTTHSWLIMKEIQIRTGIQIMTLMITMKKQII